MRFLLRVDPGELVADQGAILLDWFATDRSRSTVQYDRPERPFLAGLSPSLAMDLLRLGGAVFCVDKLLESGEQVVLIGHHDSSLTDHTQTELFAHLVGEYTAIASSSLAWR
jgi:hypothetical protein